VGVANVNRPQLDEAVALAGIAAAQVALSPFDERALRGGLVERCAELGAVPIAGARRPETALSVARAATLDLDESERTLLTGVRPARTRPRIDADVVLVMGIPGAGKSRLAADYVRAATCASTATSAAASCERWPGRSTRRWPAGHGRSSSTTPT
jgi:diketogulonate reductase-like aldo/keto reductase